MKKHLTILRERTFVLALLAAVLLFSSCQYKHTYKNWVNWNFVFKPGTDSLTRANFIQNLKNEVDSVAYNRTAFDTTVNRFRYYLLQYLQQKLGYSIPFFLFNAQDHYCSCKDTLLWNLTADLEIEGSGQSAPTPPPPPTQTQVSGDADAIGQMSLDNNLSKPSSQNALIDYTSPVSFEGSDLFTDSVLLGIIDTGIDTTLFDPIIRRQLFVQDGTGAINVLPGSDSTAFSDDDPVRHGSAVATIALGAFYNQSKSGKLRLPRLLIIKALDGNGSGNTFTISCGLSYAIRHHAKIINASLGYYGAIDSVLSHYLLMSAQDSIPVIAAAGNTDSTHDMDLCRKVANTTNLLQPGHLFYPACQSQDPTYNIISVTGLQNPSLPCFYQNYSSIYVSIGVVNDNTRNPCCSFGRTTIPFITRKYVLEGSSFATPVISGELGFKILRGGKRNDPGSYLNMLNPNVVSAFTVTYTKGGQYIIY